MPAKSGTIPAGDHSDFDRSTIARWVQEVVVHLHRVSTGRIATAQLILRRLLDPSKTLKMAPVLDDMDLLLMSPAEAAFHENMRTNIQTAVSKLQQQLPRKEAWISYQVMSTLFGGMAERSTDQRRFVRDLTKIGHKALDNGGARWEKVVEEGGGFYQPEQAPYKNRLDQKYEGIDMVTRTLWGEVSDPSPCKGDVWTDHRTYPHKKPRGCDGKDAAPVPYMVGGRSPACRDQGLRHQVPVPHHPLPSHDRR